MPNIGFITSKKEKLKYYFPTSAEPDLLPFEPPFTPDDQLTVNYLRSKGTEVESVIWGNDDLTELQKYKLLIMRSPWDYMDTLENRRKFPLWIQSLSKHKINVENSVPFMSWLVDKKYLIDLKAQNIPIIDTLITNKKERFNLLEFFQQRGPTIVKPCVSGSGAGLYLIKDKHETESFQDKLNELCSKEDYLVQPFISDIKLYGEWSLTFIDGKYSHAAHKLPKKDSVFSHTEKGGTLDFKDPPKDLLDHAINTHEKIMKAFRLKSKSNYEPLYLRCDFIQSGNSYLLSECEGVEPELFLRARKGSEKSLGDAILKRIPNN